MAKKECMRWLSLLFCAMTFICYKAHPEKVTRTVRYICAYFLCRELTGGARQRLRAGIKITDGLKGESVALAGKQYDISGRSLNNFNRRVRDQPDLLEALLNGENYNNKTRSPKAHEGVYGKGWSKAKHDTIARDGNRCAICAEVLISPCVHHIDADKYNNASENLITLCYKHHMETINYPDGELNQACKYLAQKRSK